MIRKNKEFITLKCSSMCFNQMGDNYFEEDLNRNEKNCLANCFHKTFRYLAYANTVHTFFTGDPEVIKGLMDN